MDIIFEQWDEQQFLESRQVWKDILIKSSANQLFMSWEWLSSWWEVYADKEKMALRIIVAKKANNSIIGIAPLFISKVTTRKVLTTSRLQFIGHFWRGGETMNVEETSFIVDNTCTDLVIEKLFNYIDEQPDWDEFVLPHLNINSKTCQALFSKNVFTKSYRRRASFDRSYYLKLPSSFDDYLKGLGQNTRLKLFNRRKLLSQFGKIRYESNSPNCAKSNFGLLEKLHRIRWGQNVFDEKKLDFNIRLANLLAVENWPRFSILYLDNNPISIQYNYLVGKKMYNLQAGFDDKFHKKIPLGYLHFGYEIEAAIAAGLSTYEYLIGEGKNANYKESLSSSNIDIIGVQVIRSQIARHGYKAYDLVKSISNT